MKQDTFARKNGIPPVAAKTVCIDLDKTIIPWGSLESVRPPFPGVAAAIQRLKDEGYRIVILTSRVSPAWWEDEARLRGVDAKLFGNKQYAMTVKLLNEGGIPFDVITSEKVPALVYFDDKAVRVSPSYALDQAIRDFLNGDYA